MRKSFNISSVVFFIIISIVVLASAAEEKIPLTATASGVYADSPNFVPEKAVDGSVSTCWIAPSRELPWWIILEAEKSRKIPYFKIFWYSTAYIPTDYDILISQDGADWTPLFTGLAARYDKEGDVIIANTEARYIKLAINRTYPFPIIREFEAYGDTSIPRVLRFQGTLEDNAGVRLNGTFEMLFSIYDTESGGVPLWQEAQDITVENGLLDAELGSVSPIDMAFDRHCWLGIKVGQDDEITPRFRLTTFPYAINAEDKQDEE